MINYRGGGLFTKMMDNNKSRNNSTSIISDDEYINIHFIIDERREIASFRRNQVTKSEIKELFRTAAKAGPLDIIKLRKGDKILNITPYLQANTANDPYILQIVCTHPISSGIIESDILQGLEKRIVKLEQGLYEHGKALNITPCIALRDVKQQVDSFKKKLEKTEHLSWLGFCKKIPDPICSQAYRSLYYRRKSNSMKQEIREKFFNICDIVISSSVREWLRSPTFDTQQWEDDELLLMLQTMFVELELPQKFNIPLSTLRNFIYEVYNNYNDVPFHNFRHCFCVTQMMYTIVLAVDLMSKIGDLEVLVLIISCICHDLDHPGYNNIYQINARTELALRYNDISPLENHHCSMAFRILEIQDCNILSSVDWPTYRIIREGIIRCILATDMARHNEILQQFTNVVHDFDYTNKAHINLLSMVLIKVADISNEARPMDVAEPWLDNLLMEFFKQSDAEKLEGLPVTPFMDRDKVTKPSSQCSFIGLVLLPLFKILGELFPELQDLIVEPVKYALEYYQRLNEAAKDGRHQRRSIIDHNDCTLIDPSSVNQCVVQENSQHSPSNSSSCNLLGANTCISSNSLIVHLNSTRNIPPKHSANALHLHSLSIEDKADSNVDDINFDRFVDIQSTDSETATEVEISEKTLKFKISTDGFCNSSTQSQKSYPGSRKSSREKPSNEYHNYDFSVAIRKHECEIQNNCSENCISNTSLPESMRTNEVESKLLEPRDDNQHHTKHMLRKKYNEVSGNSNPIDNVSQQRKKSLISNRTNNVDSNEYEIRTSSMEVFKDGQCCCKARSSQVNQKSFLSRLRNLTDRLSISFDSKESTTIKSENNATIKLLNKSLIFNNNNRTSDSFSSSSFRSNNDITMCKNCNFSKEQSIKDLKVAAVAPIEDQLPDHETNRCAKIWPKTCSQNSKSKIWRTVFAKGKRPTDSLETLPNGSSLIEIESSTSLKYRIDESNSKDRSHIEPLVLKAENLQTNQELSQRFNFNELEVRLDSPDIFVDPRNSDSSRTIEDIGNADLGIRRSFVSMEDISKITKNKKVMFDDSLELKKDCEYKYSGSLDSMICKNTTSTKKSLVFCETNVSSQIKTKRQLPGLFSRFKSGVSIQNSETSNPSISNNSSLLYEQQTSSWISSFAASFRSRIQAEFEMQPHTSIQQQNEKHYINLIKSSNTDKI